MFMLFICKLTTVSFLPNNCYIIYST